MELVGILLGERIYGVSLIYHMQVLRKGGRGQEGRNGKVKIKKKKYLKSKMKKSRGEILKKLPPELSLFVQAEEVLKPTKIYL